MTEATRTTAESPDPGWTTRLLLVRVALKGLLFLALNALAAVAFLKVHESTLHYQPWETDSILLVMPEDTHRDVVMLGTSRAYLFSRFQENHAIMESMLGRSVFNMALPQGGGIKPARFYLESYVEADNSADDLVYFLDPFVLFSTGANESHKFVYFEPFRFRFLAKLVANGYGYRRIVTYIRSKFGRPWLRQQPELLLHHTAHYPPELVTPDRIRQRLDSLYYDGMQDAVFTRYTAEFQRIVALCRAHNIRLTVAIAPTLLGPEPGHARMLAWLEKSAAEYGFRVYDWVNAMPDYTRFYNLDHMNRDGVETFMRDFLRPALDTAAAASSTKSSTALPTPNPKAR
jgi:hypothetical protein